MLDTFIDINENKLLKQSEELLAILLKANTTGKNIIWVYKMRREML